MSVKGYKCPGCGNNLQFDSSSQKLSCSSCGNEIDVSAYEKYAKMMEENEKQDTYSWSRGHLNTAGEDKKTRKDGKVLYDCPFCGGEIEAEETAASAKCAYCDSLVVLSEQISGEDEPELVIPFQLSKEEFKEKYLEFCKNKKFVPKEFKSEKHIKEVKGIYVPFWLFCCKAQGSMNFDAERIKKWDDSDYKYTKTDYYLVNVSGSVEFSGVPVDGSAKMDDTYMEAIEPYDFSKIVEFEPGYLSGFEAEKYDVSEEEVRPRAEERIRKSVVDVLSKSVDKKSFHSVKAKNVRVSCAHGGVYYALLPVWTLQTEYKGKLYQFAMNGQTGKVAGEIPADAGWFFKSAFRTFVISSLIMYLLFTIF